MKTNADPALFHDLLQELLLSMSIALVIAANGLARMAISADDGTALARALFEDPPEEAFSGGDLSTRLDPQRLLLLTVGVSKISGRSIDSLMRPIFEAHPGLPLDFISGEIAIQALDSFHQIVAHGEESGNALLLPEFVVEDVARGTAFYAVKRQDCIEGTIALRLGDSKVNPQAQVERVTGVNNADASPELSKLAQSLADSWVTARQLECWAGYARQCAEWRRLATDSASQLSQ